MDLYCIIHSRLDTYLRNLWNGNGSTQSVTAWNEILREKQPTAQISDIIGKTENDVELNAEPYIWINIVLIKMRYVASQGFIFVDLYL